MSCGFCNCRPRCNGLLRDGEISTGHAKALLTHPDPVKAANDVVKRGLSVRQTEALVKTIGRSIPPQAATRMPREHQGDSSEIAALAGNLTERLGLKVEIKFNGKGGALILNYADLDQLDSLLALLNR